MRTGIILSIISAMSLSVTGSGGGAGGGSLEVYSDSFKSGDYIPKEFSCEGFDHSPDIQWRFSGTAKSFALICEDPDAPGGSFIHWVIYNIAGTSNQLKKGYPHGAGSDIAFQGTNDFGRTGYNGPCPPRGKAHRYIFTVYALNTTIRDKDLSSRSLKIAMKDHILGSGSISGLFKR